MLEHPATEGPGSPRTKDDAFNQARILRRTCDGGDLIDGAPGAA